MSVTTECAGRLAASMKADFRTSDKITDDLVARWVRRLALLVQDDPTAELYYRRFADGWADNKPKPTLNDLARYMKNNVPQEQQHYRPADKQCGLCLDTGYIAVLMPTHPTDYNLTASMKDFYPGVLWAKTRVGRATVPCICGIGKKVQAKEGLAEDWVRARDEQLTWAKTQGQGLHHVLMGWQKRCCTEYNHRIAVGVEADAKARAESLRKPKEVVEDVSDDQVPF